MKKTIIMLIAITILLSACNMTGQTVKQNFKIGTLVPLTGPGSNLGQPMVKGMELAIKENDLNIKLYVEDSKLSGEESVKAVNYLLTFVKPDIYTALFALPANAISPILKNAKKPLVYEAYSRQALEDNPYAF